MLFEIQHIAVANLSWFIVGVVLGVAMTDWETQRNARHSPFAFTLCGALLLATAAGLTALASAQYPMVLAMLGLKPTFFPAVFWAALIFAGGMFIGGMGYLVRDVARDHW